MRKIKVDQNCLIVFDQKFVWPKFCRPTFFPDLQFFQTQTFQTHIFFRPNIFSDPTIFSFVWRIKGKLEYFCQNEKNVSCSKLPEMARKLVKNDFLIFLPPQKIIGYLKKKIVKNEKNQSWSKLPNCFWPKICMTQILQTYFFFRTYNFFRPKIFQTHIFFRPNIFSDPTFFQLCLKN